MGKAHPLIASFNGGEVSPLLDGRADLGEKYQKLLKKCENFLVTPQGPLVNRGGFKYINGTKTNGDVSRLIPFRFSDEDAYVLEFGDLYVRFHKADGTVQDPDGNTVLLIHANESDGTTGTGIADFSASEHTVTANNAAETDDAQTQSGFGNSLVFLNSSTTDYLEVTASSDFDFSGGTFTFECFIYPTIMAGGPTIYSQAKAGATSDYLRVWVDSAGTITVQVVNASSTVVSVASASGALSINQWQHLAIVEDGDDWYIFVDGVDTASTGNSDTDRLASAATTPVIGASYDGTAYGPGIPGWIDEIRISTVARYTAAFNPPQTPFGNVGSNPLEVATPYVKADVFDIKYAQSGNVLYLAHPSYAPRKLVRISDQAWKLYTIEFFPDPIISENNSPAAGLTLDLKTIGDHTGNVRTFAASAAVFATGDVGKEIREKASSGQGRATIIVVTDTSNVECDIFQEFSNTSIASGSWDLVGSSSSGEITISGHVSGGTTVLQGEVVTITETTAGTPLNVFTSGDVGKYITTDDGTGVITYKITNFTSSTVVLAVALQGGVYDADLKMTAGQWELKKSAWDSTQGFPGAVTFFENRLLWAGNAAFPDTIWGSVVDDYENHLTTPITDSSAYSFTLAGRQVNKIQWIEDGDSLFIGTAGAEWILGSRGTATAVTATNVDARPQTAHGCANVQPIQIGQEVIFVQDGKKKLRDMIFTFESEAINSDDLNILAGHIAADGIKQIDFQLDPYSTVWSTTVDGNLLGLTFLKEQEVIAWHKHTTSLGGKFESVAVIPNASTGKDEVWCIVQRIVNGSTVRYVEKMEPVFEAEDITSAPFLMMDSGATFDSVARTSLTGLDHLEGEAVQVVGDGLLQNDIEYGVDNEVLLLEFEGEDGATSGDGFKDTSGSGTAHTATAVGTAQINTARRIFGGSALLLDGDSDYLTIPDHADFDFSSDDTFTIDAWIRVDTLDGSDQLIYHHRTSGSIELRVYIEAATDLLTALIKKSGAQTVQHTTALSADTWYHIAFIGDGANYYISLNGDIEGSGSAITQSISDYTSVINIGANLDAADFFEGWIDHLRVVKGKALWTSDFTAPPVVSSGAVTITSATNVSVGAHTKSVAQLMRLEGGASDGTSQTRVKNINDLGIRFFKTYNAIVGPNENDTDRVSFTAGELFTGDKLEIDYPEGYETDGHITIIQDKPFPCTIVAVIPNIDTKRMP